MKLRLYAISPPSTIVAVEDTLDNREAVEAVIAANENLSAITFLAGTHNLGGGLIINTRLPGIYGKGNATIIKQNAIDDCSVLFYIGNSIPNGTPHPDYPGIVKTFSGALTDATKTFTLNSVDGLSVGDDVLLLLGQDPIDYDQHFIRMWNKISAIDGNDVTVRVPVPEAVSGTFEPSSYVTTHRLFKPTNLVENFEIADLKIEHKSGIVFDNSIFLIRTRNAKVQKINLIDVAASICVAECENVEVGNIYIGRSRYLGGSSGSGVSVYGSRNVRVHDVFMREVDNCPVYIENQCRGVRMENITIQCGPDKTTGPLISVLGGSKGVVLKGFTLHKQSVGPVIALSIDATSEARTEDFRILGAVNAFPLDQHFGFIEYKGVTYKDIKRFSRRIALTPSMNAEFKLPDGLYKSIKMMINSKTGIQHIVLSNNIVTGHTVLIPPWDYMPAEGTFGKLTGSGKYYTYIGPDFSFNEYPVGQRIGIATTSACPSGNFLIVECEVFIREDDGVDGLIQEWEDV